MKTHLYTTILAISFAFAGCTAASSQDAKPAENSNAVPASGQTAEAVFAGGCFWCVESDFEKLPGVLEAVSGYTGGTTTNPTYKQVTRGGTGHYEAAKIIYDPARITYRELVDYLWLTIDPTDVGGQFCDRGESYRPAVFATQAQMAQAQASLAALKTSGKLKISDEIKVPILQAQTFYDAEDYHQDYYKKNPIRYKYYRNGCGRDKRLETLWGKRAKG